MMYCTTQVCTQMDTPFVYAPYVYWNKGANKNVTPGKLDIFTCKIALTSPTDLLHAIVFGSFDESRNESI